MNFHMVPLFIALSFLHPPAMAEVCKNLDELPKYVGLIASGEVTGFQYPDGKSYKVSVKGKKIVLKVTAVKGNGIGFQILAGGKAMLFNHHCNAVGFLMEGEPVFIEVRRYGFKPIKISASTNSSHVKYLVEVYSSGYPSSDFGEIIKLPMDVFVFSYH